MAHIVLGAARATFGISLIEGDSFCIAHEGELVHETAYPRLKSSVVRRELINLYTPTQAELEVAARASKGEWARLGFLVLLKTFQRLGYFIPLRGVPRSIVEHIGHDRGMRIVPETMEEYDESGTRRRHVKIIRKYLCVQSFDESGQAVLSDGA